MFVKFVIPGCHYRGNAVNLLRYVLFATDSGVTPFTPPQTPLNRPKAPLAPASAPWNTKHLFPEVLLRGRELGLEARALRAPRRALNGIPLRSLG